MLGLTLTACEPFIGDECETSVQCPSGAICDTSVADGYCLGVGCDRDSDCPDSSACVFFDAYLSYCLATCESDGDCRKSYRCRDDVGPTKFCWLPPAPGESAFERAQP